MTQPFFSIVIPTRDRPHLLDKVLWSLARQTFRDFEVIVSDNYVNAPCKEVCNKYQDAINIRYVKPTYPLSMPNNYNYSLSFAKGQYIYMSEDKICLYKNALQESFNLLTSRNCSFLTFDVDSYTQDSESEEGKLELAYYLRPAYKYNPSKILKKYTQCKLTYENLGNTYFRHGKMLFSFIHRSLFQKVQQEVGKVFRPFSCDFTSLISLMLQKPVCFHIGKSLALYLNVASYSTGNRALSDYNISLETMKEIISQDTPWDTIKWPHPKYPGTFYNSIAFDYVNSYKKHGLELKIDQDLLLLRISECMTKQKNVPEYIASEIKKDIDKIGKFKFFINKNYNKYCQYIENKRWWLFLRTRIGSFLGIKYWCFLKTHRKNNHFNIKYFNNAIEYAEKYYQDAPIK